MSVIITHLLEQELANIHNVHNTRDFYCLFAILMFFMSVLADIHLVKIPDCAKNMFPSRSFTGDITMGVKTCGSQRHCTGL